VVGLVEDVTEALENAWKAGYEKAIERYDHRTMPE